MKIRNAFALAAVMGASLATAAPAHAQAADPFLGQLATVGFGFCPRGWATASGQILPISQNTALFALLGTTYGGNGQTTFALPDLRGRTVIGLGQGPGLSNYGWGQAGGTENTTLLTTNMPAHTHAASIAIAAVAADSTNPRNNAFAPQGATNYSDNGTPDPTKVMKPGTVVVASAGGSQPFSTMQPYLSMYVCIALQGVFPSHP